MVRRFIEGSPRTLATIHGDEDQTMSGHGLVAAQENMPRSRSVARGTPGQSGSPGAGRGPGPRALRSPGDPRSRPWRLEGDGRSPGGSVPTRGPPPPGSGGFRRTPAGPGCTLAAGPRCRPGLARPASAQCRGRGPGGVRRLRRFGRGSRGRDAAVRREARRAAGCPSPGVRPAPTPRCGPGVSRSSAGSRAATRHGCTRLTRPARETWRGITW